MSHSIDHRYTDHETRMFPALRTMERQCPPLKFGRPPYWRAPITPASDNVYVPTWNWTSPQDLTEGESVTVLDVNAAFLAAIGSVKIAHSHLVHVIEFPRELPEPRSVAPGYYRITVPHWAFIGTIVHPLGDSSRLQTESVMWVAAPTLVLLLELIGEGHIGWFEILEGWVADVATDFRSWSERLRSLRTECIDRIEMAQTEEYRLQQVERYDAFKQGYSAALSMMLTGEKCLTRRPDWAHTVYAAHAANTWRKAWRYSFAAPLVAMGAVDEIAVLSADIGEAMCRPKPPFRYDATGRQVGAMKPKKITHIGAPELQAAAALATVTEDGDDIL